LNKVKKLAYIIFIVVFFVLTAGFIAKLVISKYAPSKVISLVSLIDEQEADSHLMQPEAASTTVASLVLSACGDILLARGPGNSAASFGNNFLFEGAKEILKHSDLAFANLESPASYNGKPYPGKPPEVTFRAKPETLSGMAWAGFDIVSLANNHMYDYGPQALTDTLGYLDELGIARVGAGKNLEEARRPAVIKANGQSLAFLAYAEPIWSARGAKVDPAGNTLSKKEALYHDGQLFKKLYEAASQDTLPYAGIAHCKLKDLHADIEFVKKKFNPDYIFVSVHWGEEHWNVPTKAQKLFGRAAIDAGANAVLGHHPHVLQGVEKYRDGLIIYSMGNFVFDMQAESTYQTAVFHLELSGGKIVGLKIEPVYIARGLYAPALATGKQKEAILNNMLSWSKQLGTTLVKTDSHALLSF